jgi:predicted RecA/RadA family phage recombinase
VVGGRSAPLSSVQRHEGSKTVPAEFSDVKHVRGTMSLGRYDDPNSGTSSFSILLGAAPHLDGKYTVFGRMTSGDEVLNAMEKVETRTEGIFVMPKERIQIHSSYVYSASQDSAAGSGNPRLARCSAQLAQARAQVKSLQLDLHSMRVEKLP